MVEEVSVSNVEFTTVEPAPAPEAAPAAEPAVEAPAAEAPAKKKKSKPKNPYTNGQTRAPSVPVADLYPAGDFPPGLYIPYTVAPESGNFGAGDNLAKNSAAEAERDAYVSQLLCTDTVTLGKLRHAAEIHREIRNYTQRQTRVGAGLFSICTDAENRGRMLCGMTHPFTGSRHCMQAFPLGVSLNEVAAHWTPLSAAEEHILTDTDIVKFDTGYHVDGWLVDSAYTWTVDPAKKPLVDAARESCERAILKAGPDMLMSELGAFIEEIICSYQMDDGTPIVPVRNLSGHKVECYHIHAGKSIPLSRHGERGVRMVEGELYALETFASTGRGAIRDAPRLSVSHFMLDTDKVEHLNPARIASSDARALFLKLKEDFSTLAWSPRWLDAAPGRYGTNKAYAPALSKLVQAGIAVPYPALTDVAGCATSQHEHTFILGRYGKEVLTRGDDY